MILPRQLQFRSLISNLVEKLNDRVLIEADVIPWGAPVFCFGDLLNATVATLGLNPSNREFVNERGEELTGNQRRFHTLESLKIKCWAEMEIQHFHQILESCRYYFSGNPYDLWFKKLDAILAGAGFSYYGLNPTACHLDLVPYATSRKWTELNAKERGLLLSVGAETLAQLLKASAVNVLILNGRTVVNQFEAISEMRLEGKRKASWTLPRSAGDGVPGIGYSGILDTLAGIELGRSILVLGYNHNIQSSFGVTRAVTSSIRDWIQEEIANWER